MAQANSETTTSVLTKSKGERRRLRSLNAAMRLRIEAAIDRMIETLDALDAPTEDLEDDHEDGGQVDDDPIDGDFDDEPSLGSFDRMVNQAKSWRVTETIRWSGWNGEELDEAEREADDADQEGAVDDGPCDTDELEADGGHMD